VAFVTVPNVVVASKVFGNFIRAQTKEIQKALAESTAAAEEALGTMRTVKSLHAEDEMASR
jgi:ABC-type multidrug transport system fused ATPase/permease subunit